MFLFAALSLFRIANTPVPSINLETGVDAWAPVNVTAQDIGAPDEGLLLTANGQSSGYMVRRIEGMRPGFYIYSLEMKASPGSQEADLALFAWRDKPSFTLEKKHVALTQKWRRVKMAVRVKSNEGVLGLQIGGANEFAPGESVLVRNARLEAPRYGFYFWLSACFAAVALSFPLVRQRIALAGKLAAHRISRPAGKAAFISVFLAAHLALALQYEPVAPIYDSAENFSAAYNIAKYGVATSNRADHPEAALARDWDREPLYPYLLAGVLSAAGNLKENNLACFLSPVEPACEPYLYTFFWLNMAFVWLLAALIWFVARDLTKSDSKAAAAALIAAFAPVTIGETPAANTELAATLFLLAHSYFLYKAFTGAGRILFAIASGVSLGLLIMTKVVFLFWLLALVPLMAIYALIMAPVTIRRGFINIALIAVCAVAVLCTWQPKLYINLATLSVPDRRGAISVLRGEFAQMTLNEYVAGFVYYTPYVGEDLTKKWFGESVANKFDRGHENSYFQKGLSILSKEAQPATTEDGVRAARATRLALSPLFAYRGLFIGGCCAKSGNTVQEYPASGAPLILRGAFDFLHAGYVIVALLLIPTMLCFSLWLLASRNFTMLTFFLPSLYSFGVHAAATHYIPRYSQPLAPVALIAVIIVGGYALATMRRIIPKFQDWIQRKIDPRSSGEAIRFALATVLSAAITLSLPVFFRKAAGLAPEYGVAWTLAIALAVNFLTMRYFVFRSRAPVVREIALFAASSGIFRLFEYGAFLFLYSLLGIHYFTALLIVLTVSFVAKFFVTQRMIFDGR